MIAKSTVLILGAGASADYSFPTARQLLLKICEEANPPGPLFQFLTYNMDISASHIEAFRQALQASHAESVDFFLENRPEFEKIGKLAIAATLIPFEKYEAFQPISKPSWYETLFQLMVEGGPFEDNPLSVITFYYDRSLEAFFFRALQNLFRLPPDAAEDRRRMIKIIHVYGDLGEDLMGGGLERGYQPELERKQVMDAAKRIKIIHEVRPRAEFDATHHLLWSAAEVIFLGFGFHRRNLERLRLDEVERAHESLKKLDPIRWLACRTGMGTADIERAQQYLQPISVEFAPNRDWKISDFLSNTNCLMPK